MGQKGYTLLDTIIAVAVLGVLASFILPAKHDANNVASMVFPPVIDYNSSIMSDLPLDIETIHHRGQQRADGLSEDGLSVARLMASDRPEVIFRPALEVSHFFGCLCCSTFSFIKM